MTVAVPRTWPGPQVVPVAQELARELLGGTGSRWAHSRAVAARAASAAGVLPDEQVPALVAAAWLHDIGYAQALRDSGFHPLDGARHLTRRGWHPVVAGLVAQHSGARCIAEVLGLSAELAVFDDPLYRSGPLADAVTYADQTTSPTGQLVDVRTRMADMLRRHGPDSPNARAHDRRAPLLEQAVAHTTAALRERPAARRERPDG